MQFFIKLFKILIYFIFIFLERNYRLYFRFIFIRKKTLIKYFLHFFLFIIIGKPKGIKISTLNDWKDNYLSKFVCLHVD